MALLDIFRKSKKVEEKLKRPSKGALKSAKKTKKEPAQEKKNEKVKAPVSKSEGKSELASLVVLSPHVTEKSTMLSENRVYVFRVADKANKIMINRAIEELYGFKPVRVNMVNVPAKSRLVRGKKGVKSGYKKAVIYLRKNDKIELA